MKSTLFSPLSIQEYRRFYLVQLFSDLGNWFDFTILTVLIAYKWDLGESAVASLVIVYGLPWVLVGPFASVFVDRWERKKVLMITLLFRIIVVLGYIIAPNLFILLTLVLFKGVLASLFDPARQASIRMLVSSHQLSEAVTLAQISLKWESFFFLDILIKNETRRSRNDFHHAGIDPEKEPIWPPSHGQVERRKVGTVDPERHGRVHHHEFGGDSMCNYIFQKDRMSLMGYVLHFHHF
ncbi:MFS transporter [Aneurinibacillus thermoaerophilus]|uniref:MFS transporter n=1 Tax=Aneurinibacillus thermoaerophilus TaxID=143495 RepID=UPI002E1D6C60|nr:MFS transporter [Aneurinibacillus thermoaerophilus]MED0679968.1 MFS transporter [Aneurinibacillus thermoaerophilus]MED0763633.1 MFS transporter [Aneurinibacillus thermoaerophilus]